MDQNTKIEAHGAKVTVTPGGAVYVEINGTTVYFENGSAGLCLDFWSENEPGIVEVIDLVECMDLLNTQEPK